MRWSTHPDTEAGVIDELEDLDEASFASILALSESFRPDSPHPTVHSIGRTGPVRIVLWDPQRERKVCGKDAPTEDNLTKFLSDFPHMEYWTGQNHRPKRPAAAAFDLCAAVPAKVTRLSV